MPMSLADRYSPSRWKDSLGIAHPTMADELEVMEASSCDVILQNFVSYGIRVRLR